MPQQEVARYWVWISFYWSVTEERESFPLHHLWKTAAPLVVVFLRAMAYLLTD